MAHWIFKNQLKNIDLGLLLLRLAAGGMMLVRHGTPKFQKLIKGDFTFADPLGVGSGLSLCMATFAEFLCAILIIIGFKSRLSSIPLMIAMAVAAFIHHADDPFNKKEFPILYFSIFLLIFLLGSGKYSIDGLKNLEN